MNFVSNHDVAIDNVLPACSMQGRVCDCVGDEAGRDSAAAMFLDASYSVSRGGSRTACGVDWLRALPVIRGLVCVG